MIRRKFLSASLAVAGAGLAPAWAGAATRTRTYRIYGVTWRGATQVEKGFQDYLGSKGLNIEYIWRDAGQNPARLPEFVSEIREVKPDLVYTWGTPPTLGVVGPHDSKEPDKFIGNIPVVFALVASPTSAKIVPALKNQKRNVTGVYHVAPLEAQLEAMRAYRPFTTLGVLYNAAERNSVVTAEILRDLATKQRFKLIEHVFDRNADGKANPNNVEDKLAALKSAGAEWLYLGPDTYLFTQLERVAAAASQLKLPTFSATEASLASKASVLAGLVCKYYSIGSFAGYKAEQVLVKNTPAGNIPVETLSRFSYLVRMDVAKELDFLPPLSLFNYAEFI